MTIDYPAADIAAARKLTPIVYRRNNRGQLEVPVSSARDDAIVRAWIDAHGFDQFKIGTVRQTADARDYLRHVLNQVERQAANN